MTTIDLYGWAITFVITVVGYAIASLVERLTALSTVASGAGNMRVPLVPADLTEIQVPRELVENCVYSGFLPLKTDLVGIDPVSPELSLRRLAAVR